MIYTTNTNSKELKDLSFLLKIKAVNNSCVLGLNLNSILSVLPALIVLVPVSLHSNKTLPSVPLITQTTHEIFPKMTTSKSSHPLSVTAWQHVENIHSSGEFCMKLSEFGTTHETIV